MSTNARRAIAAALAVLGVILVVVTNPRNSGALCGVDRWQVKTLSDPGEQDVDLAQVATGVERLGRLRRPRVNKETGRISPAETTTYRVHAKLVAIRLLPDRDIDLVIANPRQGTQTMVAGFPDLACRGAKGSREKAEMRRARAALLASCGKPHPGWTRLRGTATIAGVGFFEETQVFGAAVNGMELHPVLDFKSHSCRRRSPSTARSRAGQHSSRTPLTLTHPPATSRRRNTRYAATSVGAP